MSIGEDKKYIYICENKGAGGCCIDDLQCFPTKHEHDWKKNRIEHFEFSIYHGEIFLPFREI
jgi:hypothetical protein